MKKKKENNFLVLLIAIALITILFILFYFLMELSLNTSNPKSNATTQLKEDVLLLAAEQADGANGEESFSAESSIGASAIPPYPNGQDEVSGDYGSRQIIDFYRTPEQFETLSKHEKDLFFRGEDFSNENGYELTGIASVVTYPTMILITLEVTDGSAIFCEGYIDENDSLIDVNIRYVDDSWTGRP